MSVFHSNQMLSVVNKELTHYVDWVAPIQGEQFPADHCYGLFSACCRIIPEVRQHSEIGILSIPGIPDQEGKIFLTKQSHLRIRVPINKIPLVYPLAGKTIKVGIHEIKIGIPNIYVVKPSSTLKARIVIIKGYLNPDEFLEAVQRQLDALEIKGKISIPFNQEGKPSRKTMKIKRFTVVGFTTEVSELSDEDSLKLQYFGIGGKRHIGAGIFLPCH